jgi:cold shock CspA family protein
MRQTAFQVGVDGEVTSFDAASGEGVVASAERSWPFHCTQIVGGARSIRAGTAIQFDVVAGLPGRWEATRLRAVHGGFLCPVCASVVEGREGTYEICSACNWEDDPTQRNDPDQPDGANVMSLSAARRALV